MCWTRATPGHTALRVNNLGVGLVKYLTTLQDSSITLHQPLVGSPLHNSKERAACRLTTDVHMWIEESVLTTYYMQIRQS